MKDMNSSKSLSKLGVLAGNFHTVQQGALISYIQWVEGEEDNAFIYGPHKRAFIV